MRNTKWIALLVGLIACGLIAAGCGSSDDSSSSSSTEATTSTESTATDTTATDTTSTESTSTDTTSTDTSGENTPEDVYNACLDVIEGTPAEAAAKPSCVQARDAFQECLDQANQAGDQKEAALKICQDAADQAIATLQSAG
jgi:hypothetical protein